MKKKFTTQNSMTFFQHQNQYENNNKSFMIVSDKR